MAALFIFYVVYPDSSSATFCWSLPEHWSVHGALSDFEITYNNNYKSRLGKYASVMCEKKEGLQIVFINIVPREIEG